MGVGTIDNLKRRDQILRVARQYYIDGLEQNQIAKKEAISRTTVSRLLATAREQGLVKITVNDHLRDVKILSEKLSDIYNDICFTVVTTSQDDKKMRLERVCNSAANYLTTLIKSGDIIGLGRGENILQIAKGLPKKTVRDVEIVQLDGIFTEPTNHSMFLDTISLFSKAYNALIHLLPLPLIFDDPKIKFITEQETHVRYVEKLGRVSNIALFTVDEIYENNFFNNNNFSEEDQKQINDSAVGAVLSHFINGDGQSVNPKIDQRTVSIPLENLRYKEHSIVIVNQISQVKALSAVLKAGYANEVFIDQQSAQLLLDLNK